MQPYMVTLWDYHVMPVTQLLVVPQKSKKTGGKVIHLCYSWWKFFGNPKGIESFIVLCVVGLIVVSLQCISCLEVFLTSQILKVIGPISNQQYFSSFYYWSLPKTTSNYQKLVKFTGSTLKFFH